MSGPHRPARHGLVALQALALVLGSNGFAGAIHSVHHLPPPAASHDHDAPGHGHDDGDRGAPAKASDETCPVAAAALHLSAAGVEASLSLGPAKAHAELVALGAPGVPRAAWREPARDRAPPSARPLPS